MAVNTGGQVQVFGGVENPSGTLQSTATKLFPFAHDGATLQRMSDKQKDESAIGQTSSYSDQYETRVFSSGDVGGFINADSIGLFFCLMFNTLPTTTGTTTLTHSWSKANTTTGATASFYRLSGENIKEAFKGVNMTALTMSFMTDAYATFTASLLGQAPTTTNQTSPVFNPTTTRRFKPNAVSVKLGADEGTATAIPATSAEFKYTSKATGYAALGTEGYSKIVSGGWDLMITITMLFENTTQRDLWINDTPQFVSVEATADAIGATTPKMTLKVPVAKVESWDDSKTVGQHIEETFTLTALPYDAATTFTGEIVNTTPRTSYGG